MQAHSRSARIYLGAAAVVVFWLIAVAPLLTAGARDMRILGVFQTDEVLHTNLLKQALTARTMRLVFGNYGHLYFNVTLVPLHAWRTLFGMPGDLHILLAQRVVSFAFGLATAVFVYAWAAADIGVPAAIVATMLLSLSPVLMQWSTLSHPDTAQMFFLVSSLYYCSRFLREWRDTWLVGASACAGLAFAAKYGGVFMLPVIGGIALMDGRDVSMPAAQRYARAGRLTLAVCAGVALASLAFLSPARIVALVTEDGRADPVGAFSALERARTVGFAISAAALLAAMPPPLWARIRKAPRFLVWMRDCVIAGAVFAVAFVCASPYSLRKLAFVKGLYFEEARLNAVPIAQSASAWARLVDTSMLPPVVFAAAGAVVLMVAMRRRARVSTLPIVCAAFALLYAVILVTRVRVPATQYLLPSLPALALLGGWAVQRLCEAAPMRVAAPIAIVATLFVVAPSFAHERDEWLHREAYAPEVAAGEWLECAVLPQSRIAYDNTTYVPPVFETAYPTWQPTSSWREQVHPDVIVVDKDRAAAGLEQPDNHDYYACLADHTCGFDEWFRNGTVSIYSRHADGVSLRMPRSCPSSGAAR